MCNTLFCKKIFSKEFIWIGIELPLSLIQQTNKMTTEELMRPRYKVIADWPQSNVNPFHVGDILIKGGIHFTRISSPKSIHEDEIWNYPHLLRRLEWWEERKPEGMPDYVLVTEKCYSLYGFEKYGQICKEGSVHKVVRWYGSSPFITDKEFLLACYILPATESEYQSYIEKAKN